MNEESFDRVTSPMAGIYSKQHNTRCASINSNRTPVEQPATMRAKFFSFATASEQNELSQKTVGYDQRTTKNDER